MVIAVTYDKETGNVGQHFGHAEYFKLYEVEDGRILDSAVVQPFGQGHNAVVATMMDYSVALVICQGIGDGAMEGLQQAGISVCPNVEGLADDAVAAFMQGNLQISAAANCDCDHSAGSCCGDAAGGCGSGCGGCCH